MKFRTYKEEDSFHKDEIVKEISTQLKQEPLINSENVVVWIFAEQNMGVLMELNTELSCPLFNPPPDYDYRYAWMLQLYVCGKRWDMVRMDDYVFKIPFNVSHPDEGKTISYHNYLASFIDCAKIRLELTENNK